MNNNSCNHSQISDSSAQVPYKLASLQMHPEYTRVTIGDVIIGGDKLSGRKDASFNEVFTKRPLKYLLLSDKRKLLKTGNIADAKRAFSKFLIERSNV